jgi:hypothetical protein
MSPDWFAGYDVGFWVGAGSAVCSALAAWGSMMVIEAVKKSYWKNK